MRVPICSDESILSKRTRSTLRILPRSGSTAWNSRLRPCLAVPPAESPSSKKRAGAALLDTAAGRVALDDEQLGLCRIFFLAVGKLAGERGDAERILARHL